MILSVLSGVMQQSNAFAEFSWIFRIIRSITHQKNSHIETLHCLLWKPYHHRLPPKRRKLPDVDLDCRNGTTDYAQNAYRGQLLRGTGAETARGSDIADLAVHIMLITPTEGQLLRDTGAATARGSDT